MLTSLGMGPEFQRGRGYARAGQVWQLTISSSLVTALVRGSDDRTYRARIAVRAFDGADWTRVERQLSRQAYYAAKLMAGQMPADIERVFARYGLRLFPDRADDLAMDCTCPDWQVPCRHLAAACHVLAESFDTDPFGILAWRGRGRDELLTRLRELRVGPAAGLAGWEPARQPSPADPVDTFWTAGGALRPAGAAVDAAAVDGAVVVPGSVHRSDALLDQLDSPGLTLGRHQIVDLLRPAYRILAADEGSPPR
jgi:uncharacterized Zn finger protein